MHNNIEAAQSGYQQQTSPGTVPPGTQDDGPLINGASESMSVTEKPVEEVVKVIWHPVSRCVAYFQTSINMSALM